MLRILALLCLLAIANAKSSIDPTKCSVKRGAFGQSLECAGGYVIVELCTSSSTTSCGGLNHSIKCCAITVDEGACTCAKDLIRGGASGAHVACYDDGVMTSSCTSNSTAECGRGQFSRIQCWNGSGLNLTEHCHWQYADFGNDARCLPNEVVAGICSSGDTRECAYNSHGVRCCNINSLCH